MQFPTEFEWVAPNGKGLLTSYMPIHYAAGWDLDQASTLDEAMTRAYDLFCDLAPVAATKVTLLPVGTDYTPPNKWVTQLARAWAARYRWPRFVVGLPKEFFAAVRAELAEKAKSPAPQTREMGPVYTGKDVSYIDIKQAHRRAESALVEGEKLASMALALGHRYPGRAADKAWRQLVYNAHHDGVTGTGSDQVYLDLLAGWREAWQLANDIRTAAMGDVASHIATAAGPCEGMATPPAAAQACVVFNSLSFARQGTVTVELGPPVTGAGAVVVRDEAGTEVPALSSVSRRHPDGTASSFTVQFQAPDVPGLGYRCFWVEPVPAAPKGWEPMQGTVAANERFLVEADPLRGGCLSRALDRASGREILAGSGLGNELLMYPEYPGHPWMMADHPDMAEGPWHLLPAGTPVSASERTARVVAERSALGQRLVVTGNLAGTVYTQTIALLAGSNRVDLRTCLHGFSGHDRLLRLRFATAVQGGRPLAEVAGSVIARSFALIDADAAEAPWTMDGPAQGWCGVGTTLSVHVRDTDPSKPTTDWPLGVGEVVVPTGAAGNRETGAALLVALVGKGVTASCTEAGANRYGALAGDSNLPDFRVSIGRPEENELTAAVLRSAGPGFQAELDRQLAAHGWARVWPPPTRPLAEVWAPNADLRHARDLPVLVLAGRGRGLDGGRRNGIGGRGRPRTRRSGTALGAHGRVSARPGRTGRRRLGRRPVQPRHARLRRGHRGRPLRISAALV